MFEKTRSGIREMKRAVESIGGYWPDVLRSFIAKIEADIAAYDAAPGELQQIRAALNDLDNASDGECFHFSTYGDGSGSIEDTSGEEVADAEGDLASILAAIEAAMPKPEPSIEELEAECYAAEKEHKESHLKMVTLHNQLLQAKAARKGTEQ